MPELVNFKFNFKYNDPNFTSTEPSINIQLNPEQITDNNHQAIINQIKQNLSQNAIDTKYITFKSVTCSPCKTKYTQVLTILESLFNKAVAVKNSTIGGKPKKSLSYKRTSQKVTIGNIQRCIIIGPRGGKYVKIDGKIVPYKK